MESHHQLSESMNYIIISQSISYMYMSKMSEVLSDLVTAVPVTSEEMTYSNKVYLSSEGNIPTHKQYILIKGYVLPVAFSENIPQGKIGLNKKFREFLTLSLIDQSIIKAYDPKPTDKAATSLNIKIECLFPPKERFEVDDLQLVKQFKKDYDGYYMGPDQVFVMSFNKNPMIITVDRILGGTSFVYISKETTIEAFASTEQQIRLKSSKTVKKNIFNANFSMDSLGIGGLDEELTNLFRRAFASRRLSHIIIEKYGIKHVKGILLYGPPGTGKTLIARQLANTLKVKTLQIVNGPEVFSKYVGESEENIRKLFLPAREDEKKFGDESPIHVIVFDEIDAIVRQRGGDGESGRSKDAVVNQLLTNLDGVEALNNVIVIGMTNRKDLLDQAILRPGRLEVHIQIGIPNEQGRLQILKIHTKQLSTENLLSKEVNLLDISRIAKNYTGAELEAVVKNASSYAMSKGNDIMDFSKQLEIKAGTKVTQSDFLKALEEVIPGFGIDQATFDVYVRNPLVNYGKTFTNIMGVLEKMTKITLGGSRQLTSILLYGPQGTGKTSIASHFAKNSKFTYVKIISPEKYIGVGTYGRIFSFNKIFNDAYKAKESLIILDNIERLIEYVAAGPDFNNTIMQALMVLIKRMPDNPECRLMVVGTTSNLTALDLLDLDKVFGVKLKIPLLNRAECARVLGCDLKIENVGIKKLVNFKQICYDKPQTAWSSYWSKYSK